MNRYRFRSALLVAMMVAALGGCGQKGALYLPEETDQDEEESSQSMLTTPRSPRFAGMWDPGFDRLDA